MPQSRKRPGHHNYQKPADIPASQRTKAPYAPMLLFAAFALLIALFAGAGYIGLLLSAIIGAAIGYVVGKAMERDAKKKPIA